MSPHRPLSWSHLAAAAGILIATTTLAGPLVAQHHDHAGAMPAEGLRAELIQGLNGVGERYLALADAMTAHMDWRPGEGVRSTAELFSHVAMGNFLLPTMAGVALPEGMTTESARAVAGLTDPAEIRDALSRSFAHLSHAIASVPDDALDDPATLFGRETTKRAVILLLATHAHEHLGQGIAYARVNGVTPPWSVPSGQ